MEIIDRNNSLNDVAGQWITQFDTKGEKETRPQGWSHNCHACENRKSETTKFADGTMPGIYIYNMKSKRASENGVPDSINFHHQLFIITKCPRTSRNWDTLWWFFTVKQVSMENYDELWWFTKLKSGDSDSFHRVEQRSGASVFFRFSPMVVLIKETYLGDLLSLLLLLLLLLLL